jgi:hypothetical protein
VVESQAQRRQLAVAMGLLAGFGVLLMALTLFRNGAVDDARAAADEEEARTSSLQSETASLQDVSELADRVGQRRTTAETTLEGDVAWTRVVQEVASAMPNDEWLSTFNGTKDSATGGLATVTFEVNGFDQSAPGRFLQRLQELPSLQDLWVSTSTMAEGTTEGAVVTFTSDGSLTEAAQSDRAEQLPGEGS